MEKKWSVLPASAAALLLFVSCYPGEVTSIAQIDVVITTHDDTVSFASFTTYDLYDEVVHIDFDTLNPSDSLLDRSNDALILAEVRAGIEALGYVEEMNPGTTPPDVVLLVGAIAVEKDAYFSYGWWPYYGGYPYWGGCCYGPGYGWGYPSGGVGKVTYDVGTLVITMLDPDRPSDPSDEDMTAPVLWLAAINGILSGSTAGQAVRITNLIDQAYDQSPYLDIN
jgi:hypothetical protein